MQLGPLERRVLEALWQSPGAARVRDLMPAFPETAYTTLMTTLERLHRKGLLDRVAQGRAFAYRASVSRAQIVSFLVQGMAPLDGDVLDALEQLVRERRRELARERKIEAGRGVEREVERDVARERQRELELEEEP